MNKFKVLAEVSHIEISQPTCLFTIETNGISYRWRCAVENCHEGFGSKEDALGAMQDGIFHLSQDLEIKPEGFKVRGNLPLKKLAKLSKSKKRAEAQMAAYNAIKKSKLMPKRSLSEKSHAAN